ncbi:hypothetical protein F4823DRAFT_633861 [Ustulina deusta]|nr:hypothetical protein F4823DRAFT_633861 [Ustulina deusta]
MTPPALAQPVVTAYTHEAAYDSGHLKVGSIHAAHPERVRSLVLRGVFAARKSELLVAGIIPAAALFEYHYLFQNAAWMEDGELLFPTNMEKIKNIPGAIVQGRYDLVCPPVTAWEVHKAWPKSSLHWVDDAGHSATEPGTTAKLIQVCEELAKL